MSTSLYSSTIFGPVTSRRLGKSLGVNLLPIDCKMCNFNCIYCECGWTDYSGKEEINMPDRADVYEALEARLSAMKEANDVPDVITFAGNGEPTLNPDFPDIIDDTLFLRDKYFPEAAVAVLSNATTCGIPEIKEALLKVDYNILKFDSAITGTILKHNIPSGHVDAAKLVDNLIAFEGNVILQTLFLRGSVKLPGSSDEVDVDNTSPEELEAWLDAVEKIKPSEVMIYTISRDTPEGGKLKKVPLEELETIALMVEDMEVKTLVAG